MFQGGKQNLEHSANCHVHHDFNDYPPLCLNPWHPRISSLHRPTTTTHATPHRAHMFSERYLQIIWNERLLCAAPRCQDGRTLRIVSGGLWNRGKGPDFQGAALLLGDQLKRGDVELHALHRSGLHIGTTRIPHIRESFCMSYGKTTWAGAPSVPACPRWS